MNRLDARARLVFHYAREEADRLGHAVIESEHLLLGLLREGGIAAQVLNTSGLTLEAARHRVVELIGRFERSRDAPPPAITALARRVMDLAGVEAGRYQSSLITTGHVLLGMIHAGDGVAMGIINQVQGGTKTVRRLTLQALNLPPDPEEGSNSGLSGIVAVPADSVLGRLFQAKPETPPAAEPEPVAVYAPEPVVIHAPEPVTVDTPEPVAAYAPEPMVTHAPEAVVVHAPEPVVFASPTPPVVVNPATEAVAEPYIPPAPIRLEPEPVPIRLEPEPAPIASFEPMVTKHPTPVIEAPFVPFVEKTPTLDLDVLPAVAQPEPDDDFPEALLIDEAFAEVPLEAEAISSQTEPVLAVSQAEPVLAVSQAEPVLAVSQAEPVLAVSQTEPVPLVSQTEPVLFNSLPESDDDEEDLIPIEIEELEAVQPESVQPLLAVATPRLEPALETPDNLASSLSESVENNAAQASAFESSLPEFAPVSAQSKQAWMPPIATEEVIENLVPTAPLPTFEVSVPPIAEIEMALAEDEVSSSPENEVLPLAQDNLVHTYTAMGITSSLMKPELRSDSSQLVPDLPQEVQAQPKAVSSFDQFASNHAPEAEPVEAASNPMPEIALDTVQPESDLISSVAEFEAISSEATQDQTPEILLDLTEDLPAPMLKTASWDMVTASSVIKRQIIALGGGGFSQEPENLLLDQYILENARSAREVSVPRVCFVSTAAGDAPSYIERFYTAFKTLDCEPYHLPLFKPEDWEDELEDMILGADVLYFSGGSTKNALALWKAWELEPVFQQAYEAGTVFAGISAGAICWFEQFTTDSVGRSLGAMEGLGWLPGSFTPHYDAERYRKTMLERLLRARKISPGFAADDGAAVHFINSEYAGAISSRPDARAYHVTLGRNRLVESPLETMYLGQ
jgi:dipeptidase E